MRNCSNPRKIVVDDNSTICHDAASVGLAAHEPVARASPAPDPQGFQGSESNQMPTDSLNTLSKRELINLLRRLPCSFDDVDLLILRGAVMRSEEHTSELQS